MNEEKSGTYIIKLAFPLLENFLE